jgi:hypothetical protein
MTPHSFSALHEPPELIMIFDREGGAHTSINSRATTVVIALAVGLAPLAVSCSTPATAHIDLTTAHSLLTYTVGCQRESDGQIRTRGLGYGCRRARTGRIRPHRGLRCDVGSAAAIRLCQRMSPRRGGRDE